MYNISIQDVQFTNIQIFIYSNMLEWLNKSEPYQKNRSLLLIKGFVWPRIKRKNYLRNNVLVSVCRNRIENFWWFGKFPTSQLWLFFCPGDSIWNRLTWIRYIIWKFL